MTTIAEAFVNSCEHAAEWREGRASEDGDVRHLHCAEALRIAATWARTAPDADGRIPELMPGVIEDGTGYLLLGDSAQRIFAAFCFEGPEEFDAWLGRVADAATEAGYYEGLEELMGDGT